MVAGSSETASNGSQASGLNFLDFYPTPALVFKETGELCGLNSKAASFYPGEFSSAISSVATLFA
jgi:hypothetical protein